MCRLMKIYKFYISNSCHLQKNIEPFWLNTGFPYYPIWPYWQTVNWSKWSKYVAYILKYYSMLFFVDWNYLSKLLSSLLDQLATSKYLQLLIYIAHIYKRSSGPSARCNSNILQMYQNFTLYYFILIWITKRRVVLLYSFDGNLQNQNHCFIWHTLNKFTLKFLLAAQIED